MTTVKLGQQEFAGHAVCLGNGAGQHGGIEPNPRVEHS
jgi:hypothetical protein